MARGGWLAALSGLPILKRFLNQAGSWRKEAFNSNTTLKKKKIQFPASLEKSGGLAERRHPSASDSDPRQVCPTPLPSLLPPGIKLLVAICQLPWAELCLASRTSDCTIRPFEGFL